MKLAAVIALMVGAIALGAIASKEDCRPFAIGSVIKLYC